MKKNSLQTRIILIFVLMILVILFSITFFSYVKIEQVYKDSLLYGYNSASKILSKNISVDNDVNYYNFLSYFSIYNENRIGILLDNNGNIVREDESIQKIYMKYKNVAYGLNFIDNQYVYKSFIEDTNGEIIFTIYIIDSAKFIQQQLFDYVKIGCALIGVFLILTFIISYLLTKNIVMPINKLRKNLDDVIKGNDVKIDEIETHGIKNEVYDLVEKFRFLSNQLNENVNEISNQKAQIETILLHMSDGVMAFDIYGNLIYENPAAIRLLNINTKHKRFDDIFKKLNLDVNIEKVIFLQDFTSSEQRLVIGDSVVNIYFETFQKEDDVIGGVIVLVQDITKQVKLDDMRKEFVSNVSHELKTPITIIKGYAEALMDDMDPEMHDKCVNVIYTETNRMARLVRDLLQLSRYDSDKVNEEKRESFDLGELVKGIAQNLSIEAEKRGHDMQCYVTAEVPNVYAEKYAMEQVIINIISNSIKYTLDNGEIKIYVGFLYNYAYVKVIDNGIGIPKELLPRVFERFYRVDKARSREQGGTGLGLAIAKEIIEKNNGNIDIISELDKGTEVIIKIPVNQKEEKNND